ncbi:hypothetical protein [Streptomyces sp. NRRL F-5630]|uniref:hypothetical protein n=1 Tax=Streptomyces sp. NRRL F-5630 TaxID=1463864 RepID=UPI003D72B7C7
MSAFDDALRAAEVADEERMELIASYLDAHDVRPHTEFFTVVDDALYAEEGAKVWGLYPPAGHSYAGEDLR